MDARNAVANFTIWAPEYFSLKREISGDELPQSAVASTIADPLVKDNRPDKWNGNSKAPQDQSIAGTLACDRGRLMNLPAVVEKEQLFKP